MSIRFKKSVSRFHIGMRTKLVAAIGSIVTILLISSVLSIWEFRRMSNHVSEAMADKIMVMNMSTELAMSVDEYNLRILSLVGQADSIVSYKMEPTPWLALPDSIINVFCDQKLYCCDSLRVSYQNFVETSRQLEIILASSFLDSREWYFTLLQPSYNHFRKWQDEFNRSLYNDLHSDSESFDASFYRSLMPGVVSVIVGIILCLLLLFFLIIYYVVPVRKMLDAMDRYKRFGQPYKTIFEGNDELQDLNGNIFDIVDENITLKHRLKNSEH